MLLVLLGGLAVPTMGWAQARLSGVVLDSLTQQPLPFGTVFLANTTLGNSTDKDGQFVFEQVPPGTYEVVASYLGYKLRRQAVVISTTPQQLTFRLPPAANALGEVVVRATRNNPDDYRKFAETFLGSTSFSRQCRILDPEAVRVHYNAKDNELRATCAEFVTVENRALGYRIKYYGLDFRLNFREQWMAFYGWPIMEPLRTHSARQQRRWEANRRAAYLGSLTHFLRSVYQNRVAEEGFQVLRLRRITNPARAQADSLLAVMRQQSSRRRALNPARFDDSLSMLVQVPAQLQYLYTKPLPTGAFRQTLPDSGHVALQFPDLLQVTYDREKPDPAYAQHLARTAPVGRPAPSLPATQVSVVHLLAPRVVLQANGQPTNPLEVLTEEYWGFEKIGEFLPLNYEPPTGASN
ncbi:carboxypeptidase-like regulatory domain-containing protein [Hymenobacter sp. HSC-4F20]|uniref:carboxypeptidase-like regulatory domain-containing protein n=1 Tax=Hymenobacter sp. HSC-4F20 TaxID=2864135 RepID=UPI001C72B40F|nr:carboxypeptidase-like regulatory domain-containing protein [Hymenobacter sp. HSC-4F20]MBX0290607.1 carboxypeptidase-like regulatory domain-containing protein [Hymenobacter sp. HSC-4F20]